MAHKNWYQGLVCGFDLETTGVDPFNDSIVQIGFDVSLGSVLAGYGQFPIDALSYEHLVQPGIPIPNSEIHGVTDDMVLGANSEAVEITELVWFLRAMAAAQIPVVAYNAAFDFTFARSVARRHNVPWDLDDLIVLDPLVIDRKVDKWRKGSRKQADVASLYGIEHDFEKLHSARFDAGLGVEILRAMGHKHSTRNWATREFSASLATTAVKQQAELQAYFTKSGKLDDNGDPLVIKTGWPYLADPRG